MDQGLRISLDLNERYSKKLPPTAISKLRAIVQRASSLSDALHGMNTRRLEVKDAVVRLRIDVSLLQKQNFIVAPEERENQNRKFRNPADIAKDELALVEAEYAKLSKAHDAATEEAQEALRLRDNLKLYIDSLQTKSAPFEGAVDVKLAARETPITAIEHRRRRIRELDADAERTRCAPIHSAEAKKSGHRQIDELAARGAPKVLHLISYARAQVGWPEHNFSASVTAGGFINGSVPDALSLVAHLFRDQLVAALDREIDRLGDDQNALSDQERAKQLRIIDADRLMAAREEEYLIHLLEASGGTFSRRPDADPRAVLNLADAALSMDDATGTAA